MDTEVMKLDWEEVLEKAIKEKNREIKPEDITPIPPEHFIDATSLSAEESKRYYDIGLKAISEGKVAAVVLAGGQASRLGSSQPKGAYPLGPCFGPPSSLLYMHTARLNRLLELAKQAYPDSTPTIPWLIMTSKWTLEATNEHMNAVLDVLPNFPDEFDSVVYLRQMDVPTFDFQGRMLKNPDGTPITNPNGNGGVFLALSRGMNMFKLKNRGVKYVHVFSVDNILNRPADPTFIGAFIEKKSDCAAKVVEKMHPDEAVGNLCVEKNVVRVIEYSEIPKNLAELREPDTGRLVLRHGSIANHLFSIEFLQRMVHIERVVLPFHVAIKKVKHADFETNKLVIPDKPNAYKLESFIFDAFRYSWNFLAYQVDKKEEFSPLKNSNDVGMECLATCLSDMSALHHKWLGMPITETQLFVDPSVSYAGEDVDAKKLTAIVESPADGPQRIIYRRRIRTPFPLV